MRVYTRAKKAWGLSSSSCRMGSANAPVLPEPVCARPMTSLPANACGMDCAWMSDGIFHPSAAASGVWRLGFRGLEV